jgi:NADPH-dependent 2,4-dienoyl-CoA reductase/sulfur reductase-like enzyme
MLPAFISFSLACAIVQGQLQSPLQSHGDRADYYRLPHIIERVAVIGAGPAGLQQTAALLNAGLKVRMFERAPRPGGQWMYTDKTPISAPFPYVALSLAVTTY